MRLSLDTSLRRLRTDYLDIYWVHMWDRSTPVEETMRALDDEVRAGRILYVGISDTPAWLISRANTPGWQLTWAGDDTPPGPPRIPDLYSWAPLVAESMCCTDLVHLGGRSAAIIPGYRGTVSTPEASKFRMSWRTDPP
jgi:hypothetical protein